MNIWWPRDGSDEWLARVDGMLAVTLLGGLCRQRQLTSSECEPVLEVGVWKGAWTSVILMNLPEVQLDGVDPYPGFESVREHMEARLADLGVNGRFKLSASLTDLADDACFSMIHIDGEHSEKAVETELAYAADHLTDDGIVVVDDFRVSWFPGIASALFRFLGSSDLKMFAASEAKAYLARSPYADAYYEQLERAFAGSDDLPVRTHWRQLEDNDFDYIQWPEVGGQRVLLCGIGNPRSPSGIRRLAWDLLPPIAVRAIQRVKRGVHLRDA